MVDTVFAQKDGKRRYSAPKSEEALWKAHVPRVFAKETGDSTYEPEQQARPARRNKTVEESTPRAGNRPVGNVLAQEKGKVGFSAATSDEPFQEVHEPRVFAETVGYSTYERERQARSARRNESMHSRSRPPRSSLPRWPTPRERQPISLQDDSGAHALRIYDDISDRGEIDTGELGAEYSKLGEDAILEAAVVVQASPAKEMKIVPAPGDDVTVPPTLAHGLDRVLFSPGVHMLQDPRTGVYNFPADLKNIMSVHDFDFDALPQYQPPSGDSVLEKVAVKYKRRYYGSTSNMTVILSQFHFFLSRARPLHVPQLSKAFQVQPEFTKGSLSAASFFLRYKPKTGTYALDVDKSEDEDMILMWLGRSMEKQLVTNSTEYSLFHRENSHQLTPEMRADRETYHYTAFGEFMMRSQQDAMDARLPGEGTFDLKTRAVEAVRYDIDYINERATCDYQLRTLKGERESFEREYYDMARSAFLKYLLQVRMGRMDGIMVAYHNVKRLFGFQYIPREEMDAIIHGPSYRNIALPEFQVSIEMMGDLFGRATEKFPETSLHCLMHYEERDQELHVFVTPMSEEEIAKTQKREESRMFNVKKKAQKIAEAILNSDETGAKARKTTEGKKCAEDQFNSTLDDDINYTIPELKDKRGNQVFVHYRIEINHIINGERLPPYTPPVIKDDDDWKIEYLISEIPEHGDRESVIEFSRAMQTRKLGRAGSHSSMLRSLGEAGARYQDLLDARDHEKNFETYAPERGEVLYQERIEKMREEMRKRMESGEEPTLEQLKGYKEVNGFWEKPSPKEKPWSKE
ncbi:mitochondrial protein Pet127-domain-containing protein [Myxozyma melibiosi]|uniref:Mitochondrial protein Pet127-domain-containing protein n=1 Tax=Myxozyma melibiosi TaxID=54550 RepID=A0ABR1F0C8_9ASCO